MSAHIDEDAIDLQDLQAQIDLSMSFAQNLVTSWVKPAHFAQTNRKRELEDELKEYMRRPARLGVGAPIPETQSLARESARLKSRFESGKKRRREDEGAEVKNPSSDDEEESRAGAIRTKARVDPFEVVRKKKKKRKESVGPSPDLFQHHLRTPAKETPRTLLWGQSHPTTRIQLFNSSNHCPLNTRPGLHRILQMYYIHVDIQ